MKLRGFVTGNAVALLLPLAAGLWPSPGAAQTQWNEITPTPGTYRQYPAPHRTVTVDIPVKANGGEIEYMVKMTPGQSLVYSWRGVEIDEPGKLTSEFHGHTEQPRGTPGTLVFYRKAMGASENGTLVAPFGGHHGWYLKNDTGKPVTIRLTLSGFYEIVPGQIPN